MREERGRREEEEEEEEEKHLDGGSVAMQLLDGVVRGCHTSQHLHPLVFQLLLHVRTWGSRQTHSW